MSENTEKSTEIPSDESDEYDISSEEIEEISKEATKETKNSRDKQKDESYQEDNVEKINYKNVNIYNINPQNLEKNEDKYDSIVLKNRLLIKRISEKLSELIEKPAENKEKTFCGKYNLTRGTIGTSPVIFDRKKTSGDEKDAAIMILIDNSGSMSGKKIDYARKTAIILTESLVKAGIPVYVIGFDYEEQKSIHRHYVTWKCNNKYTRTSLAAMKSGHNNFDACAVNYAMETLKKRAETQKIMFVISDGKPSAGTLNDKLLEVRNIVENARKKGINVFGIGIDEKKNDSLAVALQKIYGTDYIFLSDLSLLCSIMMKKIKNMLS